MSEAADILRAISDVHQAGADKARGWVMNNDAQILAAVHQAMANEAAEQAATFDRVEAARHD